MAQCSSCWRKDDERTGCFCLSYEQRPEQPVIDEIDRLVNESIAHGPTDDYEAPFKESCELCHGEWHGAPNNFGCPGAYADDKTRKAWGAMLGGELIHLDHMDFLEITIIGTAQDGCVQFFALHGGECVPLLPVPAVRQVLDRSGYNVGDLVLLDEADEIRPVQERRDIDLHFTLTPELAQQFCEDPSDDVE